MLVGMLICLEIGRRLGIQPREGSLKRLYCLLAARSLAKRSTARRRDLFRKYVDSRLATFRKLPDLQAARVKLDKSKKIQMDIWTGAVGATCLPSSNSGADKLVLPALNEMIDLTTMRTMTMKAHPPLLIFEPLFFLELVCSLLAGYGMAASKYRSWLHITAFAGVAVISFSSFSKSNTRGRTCSNWKPHTTKCWSMYAQACSEQESE
jgi:hypothetical protein